VPIHRPLELVKGAPDTIAAMRRSMSRALASAPCCLPAPDVDGRIHRCMAALVAQADAGRSLTRPAEDTSRFLDCPSDGVGCSRRVSITSSANRAPNRSAIDASSRTTGR